MIHVTVTALGMIHNGNDNPAISLLFGVFSWWVNKCFHLVSFLISRTTTWVVKSNTTISHLC